jgi:hypothetical protein
VDVIRMMKKLVVTVILFIVCLVSNNMAFAGNYETITSNEKIASSLTALESVNRNDVLAILRGNNTTRKPIRVMFRELEVYGLANCEAVTMKTQAGGLVIYINKKHQNAPKEALACLIAHESQHHTQTGTKAEEVRAWVMEVSTWNAFVRQNSNVAYSNSTLVKRLNYIDNVYTKQQGGVMGIEKVVSNIGMYKGLN